MAMFIHDQLIVDTDFIACVYRCNGTHAFDGHYALGILLALGTKGRQVFTEFHSADARDAAFLALGACLQYEQGRREEEEDIYDLE